MLSQNPRSRWWTFYHYLSPCSFGRLWLQMRFCLWWETGHRKDIVSKHKALPMSLLPHSHGLQYVNNEWVWSLHKNKIDDIREGNSPINNSGLNSRCNEFKCVEMQRCVFWRNIIKAHRKWWVEKSTGYVSLSKLTKCLRTIYSIYTHSKFKLFKFNYFKNLQKFMK